MTKKNYLKKFGAWLIIVIGMVGLLVAVGLGTRSAFALNSDLVGMMNASAIIDCLDPGKEVFTKTVNFDDMKNGNISDFMNDEQFSRYVAFADIDLIKQIESRDKYETSMYMDWTRNTEYAAKCTGIIGQLLANKSITIPKASDGEEEVTKFMENMGYKKVSANNEGGEEQCLHYNYNLKQRSGTFSSSSVCAKLDDDGTIKKIWTRSADNLPKELESKGVNIEVRSVPNSNKAKIEVSCYPSTNDYHLMHNEWNVNLGKDQWGGTSGNDDTNTFLGYLEDTLIKMCGIVGTSSLNGELARINGELEPVVEPGAATEKIAYELQDEREVAKAMTNYLIGTEYYEKPGIYDANKFVLYQDYLVNFYGAETHCDWSPTDANVAGEGKFKEVKLFIGSAQESGELSGEFKTCYAKATKNENLSVGGVNDNTHLFGEACDFNCVAKWLGESEVVHLQELPPQPATSGSSDATTVTKEDGRPIVDCDQFENIGAMQWVLCPTMNNSQYTANMLDEITEKLLSIDADIYGPGTKTAEVWDVIRNIANVLLVVFFSVVIISQLTGYGIDNYGIKKMLPRIIVMAIIVNLSLYICQIAIDLSNILGVGLRDLFGGMGAEIGGVDGTSFIGGMIAAAFASAGGVEMGIGAGAAIFALGAHIIVGILIAVLVAVLVIIVAIFVLFLMLGVRKIIVIVCVILSPLAFAAFILPNTQGMFKKWWDLFKAALVIFPICGFVSGISGLLKTMAMADGTMGKSLGAPGAIVMMILPYAVFFLIPILLKNAIAALGKMGGALTAFGQTVKNGGRQLGQTAWNTAQKTEGFKNIQAEAARRRQSQSAQRTIDRLQRIRDNGGTLNERDTRRLARAHEIQRKLDSENTAARTVLAEQEYAGKSQNELVHDWNEAFDAGETEKMDALTNVITSRHGPGGVNAIAQSLARKQIFDESTGEFIDGDNGHMARSFNALQANMMQNSALSNAMQNKASDVFQMISSGGYVKRKVTDADGNVIEVSGRANVATHAANNSMATQHKDWATQSTATLERAVTNGSLSQQTAVQILQSTDPTIQSGIQSDADKRMVLQAAAAGYRGDFANKNAVEEASQQYQNMDHEYIGKTAADVYEEATRENLARTIGVDSEYANRSADDVYDEAMRENREFNVREQDRAMRQAQAENIQEIRNSLGRMTGGSTGGAGQAGNAEQNDGAGQSGNAG